MQDERSKVPGYVVIVGQGSGGGGGRVGAQLRAAAAWRYKENQSTTQAGNLVELWILSKCP